MFKAKLLSLSSGQSYSDVEILELQDLINYGINPNLFGDETLAFYANGNLIIGSAYNFRVCILDKRGYPGADSTYIDRVVLDKDIIYDNCTVYTDLSQIYLPNIMPNFRKFVFYTTVGTVIVLSRNIIGLISKDNRAGGSDKVVPIKSYSARKQVIKTANVGSVQNRS